MKFLTLVAAVAMSLVAVEATFARGRRGCASCNAGCPGGVCSVAQAPIQKDLAKGEPSPSDQTQQAQEAPSAPVAQAESTAAAPQRTRRFAGLSRMGRRGR